jgi:4'-phosphopantetheinyl transferase
MDEAEIHEALALLSQEERARHDRFVHARDRRDFAAAHALLRRVLSTYDDTSPAAWAFEATPAGKPRIARREAGGPGLTFSLSHTRGFVACAVARGMDVGVDVESIDRGADGREIARRYFSAAEAARLDACPDAERAARFVELWTLKEAYVKAIGEGLSVPLDGFSFAFDEAGHITLEKPVRERGVYFTFALMTPSPRTRLAVAIRSESAAPIRVMASPA